MMDALSHVRFRGFWGCLTAFCAMALFLSWSSPASAQGGYKIGIVNVKEVFDNYDKQKDGYTELENERNQRQKFIDGISAEVEVLQKRHTEEKDSLSQEDLDNLEDRIESRFGVYKAEYKRLQDEIDRKEKKLLESLFKEIQKAVGEVGAKGNYHLVLEGGQTGRSGVLYFSPTLNMTQQVIDYLNEQHKKTRTMKKK